MNMNSWLLPIMLIYLILLIVLTKGQIQSLEIRPEVMDGLIKNIDELILDGDQGPEIRKLIRGAFHDCTQGCDGRLGLEKTGNRGLEKLAKQMNDIYFETPIFRDTLSRADFWVLCERRALAKAIKTGAARSGYFPTLSPNFPVHNYGRPNITGPSTEDDNEGPFPEGLDNWPKVLSVFQEGTKNMISEAELVALLGTHNIGSAVQTNSGFSGPWGTAPDRNSLNNGLYTFLMGIRRST